MVGIVDTNNSPDHIDYVIPANDDSMRAIEIYVRCAADAILDAKQSSGASRAHARASEEVAQAAEAAAPAADSVAEAAAPVKKAAKEKKKQ